MLSIAHLIEAACAVHLSSYVQSPFPARGGLMLVGPPGALKSTVLSAVRSQYHDALLVSDLNVQTLMQMRDTLASNAVRTLLLGEMQKIYERNPQTALNIEGSLRAMVEEGFANASFEDQRVNSVIARATVIGAMTPATYRKHFPRWSDSGFHRRFLWATVVLDQPTQLDKAVVEWERIAFDTGLLPNLPLGGAVIPNQTTRDERERLQRLLRDQPGESRQTQLQLLVRMLAVLRWWYGVAKIRRDPMSTLTAFGESLAAGGAQVSLRGAVTGSARRVRVSPHRAGQTLARKRWRKRK